MAVPNDTPTSLAELRRGRGSARRPPAAAPRSNPSPSLFDLWDVLETQPGSALVKAELPSPDSPASFVVGEAASTTGHRATQVPHSTLTDKPSPSSAPIPSPAPPVRREPQIWTVTELVRQVREVVEGAYRRIAVEGEISNWRPAASGHCYFTLKDGAAQLSAVLFRKQATLLRFRPKDGDTVRLRGQLSIYESRGQMQLIGESMEQVGLGALLAAVRELKERLRREGLFDRKRPLPAFPRCIGVVTSLGGAALRDIVKVCRRRHAAVNLLIYPVAVQGPGCASQVAAALAWFSGHPERADVVLVARGGGSWEDLHGFDDERVARAIATCALPVISGVGHATDTTIADAAADVCAPTPSAAAELLTAAQHRVEEHVERLRSRMLRAGRYEMLQARQRLARLSAEGVLRRVETGLERRAQRLDDLSLRLQQARERGQAGSRLRLFSADARLRNASPAIRLLSLRARDRGVALELRRCGDSLVQNRRNRLERVEGRLVALSPLRVLERGYALVYGPDGRLLRSAAAAAPGERIVARLAEGSLRARVEADG